MELEVILLRMRENARLRSSPAARRHMFRIASVFASGMRFQVINGSPP